MNQRPHSADAGSLVNVVAGGDLVVACLNEETADAQYLVMVGANLDVERMRMTLAQWRTVRPVLAAMNPAPTITDLTDEVGSR